MSYTSYIQIFLFTLFYSLIFTSCNDDTLKDEVVAIHNDFFQREMVLFTDVRMDMYESSSVTYRKMDSVYSVLISIEEDIDNNRNITKRLENLISAWKLDFDSIYSKDYFNRVDRDFKLINKLNEEKDTNEIRSLYYVIKYEMMHRYFIDITGPCYSTDNHKVLVNLESTSIPKKGKNLDLNIFYGVQDERVNFDIYMNGYKDGEYRSDLITDTLSSDAGVGKLSFIPETVGDTTISGVISIMTRRGPVHYPFTKTITVHE